MYKNYLLYLMLQKYLNSVIIITLQLDNQAVGDPQYRLQMNQCGMRYSSKAEFLIWVFCVLWVFEYL